MKPKTEKMASMKLSEFAKEIPELLERKLAEKKGNEIIVDGEKAGIKKLFGTAELKEALKLKNIQVSESARQAIEKSKGTIETEGFKKPEEKPKEKVAE